MTTSPALPTQPGFYILRDGVWKATDQLTYRTFANTAYVAPDGSVAEPNSVRRADAWDASGIRD